MVRRRFGKSGAVASRLEAGGGERRREVARTRTAPAARDLDQPPAVDVEAAQLVAVDRPVSSPIRYGSSIRASRCRRVSEDDGVRQRVRAREELLADPQQILVVLLGERDARTDAGMHEEKRRLEMLRAARAEEREVLGREQVASSRHRARRGGTP